jgi:hypothetical protein
MARRGCVHLLLEHSFVDGADRVLRAAEDLGAAALGELERELGDGAADRPLDPLGAERGFVVALALAPLLGAVGVPDRHPHDRDRRVDAAERRHARDPPAGADDHPASDLLAEKPVRRADVVRALGCDGGRLQTEAGVPQRCCRVMDDCVLRGATRLQREVEAWKVELESDHVGSEHPESFLEQLLAGLVSLEHDDPLRVHGGASLVAGLRPAPVGH